MAFDQGTRNRLAGLVGAARAKLVQEFTRQLQSNYGLDPATGAAADLDALRHLDDSGRETARILRETWRHYLAAAPRDGRDAKARRDALDRIVREQAFTVLNRLCALRMAEARDLLIESVGRGHDSRGFALYRQVAGAALGETGDAYRAYLFSVFDEFAVDLPSLFDRYSPQGRLFPRDTVLRELLALLNAADIEPLWAEDETIGWVYQYFNSVEERRQMRAESAAPRNSRELAVRNQFFTPRYVVEFLTDNTLGRIWYEMTRGQTALADTCRYLVRRPLEIFLNGDDFHLAESGREWLARVMAGDWAALADDPTESELAAVALLIDGYEEAPRAGIADLLAWAGERVAAFEHSGVLPASSLELWLLLFALQRQWRIITGSGPAGEAFLSLWRRVYHALQAALLAEPADLSQEELLRRPVFVPHRPPKDPRDIKLLDPACGSMHFGLYAFDLFERIYDEAWAIEASRGPRALARPDGLAPLTEVYADEAAFRRDVPRLILAHNLHGIDIDPRAVQIAGLSLWLRAQRSWRDQGVDAAGRPAITRAHVVCAEPMPGEREMLDAFVQGLPHRVVGELMVRVFDEMKLAGEAGALLKIEATLRGAIEAARARYNSELLRRRQDAGYLPGLAPERGATLLDLMELPDPERFWETAEEQVLAALRDFAAATAEEGSYQRHLFAEDTARGLAFIDLCRERYDVVVMNPPFGAKAQKTEKYIEECWPIGRHDLATAFVLLGLKLLESSGSVGVIMTRTPFFLSRFSEWRTATVFGGEQSISLFADLGQGVLDTAMVEAVAAVFSCGYLTRPLAFDCQALNKFDLRPSTFDYANAYGFSISNLAEVPNRPLAYWVPTSILQKFSQFGLISQKVEVKQGLATKDNERFVRAWWEVSVNELAQHRRWRTYAKGGDYAMYYLPLSLVVDWSDSAQSIYKLREGQMVVLLTEKRDRYLHRSGITYSKRSQLGFSSRALQSESIFSPNGPGVFPFDSTHLYYYLAYLNSAFARMCLDFMTSFGSYSEGYVEALPLPITHRENVALISELCKECAIRVRSIYEQDESAREFRGRENRYPGNISDLAVSVQVDGVDAARSVAILREKLDLLFNEAMGLSQDDIRFVKERAFERISLDDDESSLGLAKEVNSDLSFVFGCVFGRWDIRYATGERATPDLPDPFAPLPACPPGMLQNDRGLPAAPADVPDDYPLRISWPGILVDDEGHPEDVTGRVRQALAVIWPSGGLASGSPTADAIEAEACAILDVASLRDYFARPDRFFADHLSRYSKSRRAAPIYWPLSSANGAYTVWLYYHRLTDQTLYHVVNDFVDPKLKRAAADAARLRARGGRSRAEERELESLVDLEAELRGFREDLLRVAEFWRPNLNDGVQITAAPLWRLFRHRPWQKRLRETWAKLEAGDYDWAHLAYAIWPDRVRARCAGDKSLAIAHDLEHLYVAPPAAPRQKRPAPAAATEETADDE